MKRQHPPVFLLVIAFFVTLLAIATGPIGLAVLIMAGGPLAVFFLIEYAGHESHHITN